MNPHLLSHPKLLHQSTEMGRDLQQWPVEFDLHHLQADFLRQIWGCKYHYQWIYALLAVFQVLKHLESQLLERSLLLQQRYRQRKSYHLLE